MENPWKLINKCLICGTKLVFVPSARQEAREHEGSKICEKNHDRFSVFGAYDVSGAWQVSFYLPQPGKRYLR